MYSVYNSMPYLLTHEVSNNDNGSETVKQIILQTGEAVGLSEEATLKVAEYISDSSVNSQNNYMRLYSSQRSKYTFLDCTAIDLTGSTDGAHPSYVGHDYLAQLVETQIDSKYECKHVHTKTVGAIVPTKYTIGFTGTTTCQDCKKILSISRAITYKEYQEQQQAGEPDPVDPGENPIPTTEPIVDPTEPGETPYPEVDYSVLGFTSDIHNKTNNTSVNRLANWLEKVQQNEGALSFFGSCGDTGDGSQSTTANNYWNNLVAPVVDTVQSIGIPFAFTTGNHEQQQGSFNTTSNDVTANFTLVGEAPVAEGANYRVFCFGASQSDYKFLDSNISQLATYLASVDANTPVFVLSHFPLHNSGGRTIGNIDAVIEVLNNYPNVIFLWGHNHTNANNQEKHYDQVFTDAIDSTPINFTYAAAGCMSDSEYSSGSASVSGKGLIVTVSHDSIPKVTMVYTNASGNRIGSVYSINIAKKPTSGEVETKPTVAATQDFIAAAPAAGEQFLITYTINGKTYALDTTYFGGYTNGSSYSYDGFKGQAVAADGTTVSGNVNVDAVWLLEDAGTANKYFIKNVYTDKYLNAKYNSSSAPKGGGIFLADNKDTWTYSDGIFSSAAGSGKKLAFDVEADNKDGLTKGGYDFFTVRSNGDKVVLYKAPVTVEPKEPEVPSETPAEHLAVASALQDGHRYLLVSGGYIMTTDGHTGYTNTDSYSYTGFEGTALKTKTGKVANTIFENMVFECSAVNGGFALKAYNTDLYLDSKYSSTSPKGGDLFLSETASAWKLTSSKLYSVSSTKYLTYDTTAASKLNEGSSELFTIRSEGNAGTVTLYEIVDMTAVKPVTEDVPSDVRLKDMAAATEPVSGKAFAIVYGDRALATSANEGYVNSTNYTYTGLDYIKVTLNTDGTLDKDTVKQNTLWVFEKLSNTKFAIRNAYTGAYLNATYAGNAGRLYLGSTAEGWSVKDGTLVHASTGKVLSYETKDTVSGTFTGNVNFFTVRSAGSSVGLYYAAEPCKQPAPNDNDLLGSCVTWRQVAVGEGKFAMVLNGYVLGVSNGAVTTTAFTNVEALQAMDDNYLWNITASGEGYAFQNVASGRYLSVYLKTSLVGTKATFSLGTAAYTWTFNNALATTVTTRGAFGIKKTATYYLTCTAGGVSLSDKQVSNTAKLFAQAIGGTHNVEQEENNGIVTMHCTICDSSFTGYSHIHTDNDGDSVCDICSVVIVIPAPVA